MTPRAQFWDEHQTRYTLVKSLPGDKMYNWLFVPGGPGADSAYFLQLVDELYLPGNYWFIDPPGNGTNTNGIDLDHYDYTQWISLIYPTISRFENPIYIGHSLGAMYGLLEPRLEKILKGFIILNSSPTVWFESAAKLAEQKKLPSLEPEMGRFLKEPSEETFRPAFLACAPYYFAPENVDAGREMLKKLDFTYQPSGTLINWAVNTPYNATWVPQNVPTLIIGGTHDSIVSFELFEKDKRFQRDNITLMEIENAGHLPWLERPEVIRDSFEHFYAWIS